MGRIFRKHDAAICNSVARTLASCASRGLLHDAPHFHRNLRNAVVRCYESPGQKERDRACERKNVFGRWLTWRDRYRRRFGEPTPF